VAERTRREPESPLGRAESLRRAGRPEEAERALRLLLSTRPDDPGLRAVLALALLEQDRVDEVRRELERAADAALRAAGAAPEAVATPAASAAAEDDELDGELDRALEQAEARPEEMVDADEVARRAIAAVEAEHGRGFDPDAQDAYAPFATSTMAELLERQGDAEGARRIRALLESRRRPGRAPSRDRVVTTLEAWLEKLRREVA